MSPSIRSIVNSRRYIRGRVTIIHNEVSQSIEEFSKAKVRELLIKIKDLSEKLNDLNPKILESYWDTTKTDADNYEVQEKELSDATVYDDRISRIRAQLEEKLNSLESVVSSPPPSINLPHTPRIRPESAPLPKYGGNRDESLEKFVEMFEAILINQNYSEFEKFLLLQKSLSGRAAILLNSIEVGRQTYSAAKELLNEAFASPLTQQSNTIERLLDLKKLSKQDPLYIVSEMRQLKELFSKLNITVDLVQRFFYWNALPDLLKEQLIQITNSTTPTLEEIDSNIFRAIERFNYLSDKREPITKSKSHNYAVSVKYEKSKDRENSKRTFGNCTLCEEQHPYFKCNRFLSPEAKIKRLKDLKGCVKCGNTNHGTNSCKLNSLKCKICGGNHFPSLCTNSSQYVSGPKSCDRYNNSIVLSNLSGTAGSVLPTFTFDVAGERFRALKDTGSQTTIVTEHMVSRANFRTIKNMTVSIKGFNGDKDYETQLVEIPIQIEGDVKLV